MDDISCCDVNSRWDRKGGTRFEKEIVLFLEGLSRLGDRGRGLGCGSDFDFGMVFIFFIVCF